MGGVDAEDGLARGGHLSCKTNATAVDAEGAVKALEDLDALMSVAVAVPGWWDVDELGAKANSVVVAHHTSVFEAEELVEPSVLGPRQPRWFGVLGGDHETAVVARQAAFEDLVGFADGVGLGNAELADEAFLEGTPQPFHSAFACGERAKMRLTPSSSRRRPNWVAWRRPASLLRA